MTHDDVETQEAVDGLTAFEDTKRGYGLWRGEVIHPADPRMDMILASGDPITDTKGLGLRYTPIRRAGALPHFSVRDREGFSEVLNRTFPVVHDAIVRVIAEDIRVRGFDALVDWCQKNALPERFEVWQVRVEMRCDGYRPDICVLHPEGGRIELEIVNTHAPEDVRLEKAWGAGHIVLSMAVRDVVEQIVFSRGRGLVPDDAVLLEMLRRKRFTLCGRSQVSERVQAVWRDMNLAAYCENLAFALKQAWKPYRYRLEETDYALGGGGMSMVDDPVTRARCAGAYAVLSRGYEGSVAGFLPLWWRPLMAELRLACAPDTDFLGRLIEAQRFLASFGCASDSTASARAAKRLRFRIAAMRRVRRYWLKFVWAHVSEIAAYEVKRFGWNGWLKRNCGHKNMPAFMHSLTGEDE